jgi:hypothetical protein
MNYGSPAVSGLSFAMTFPAAVLVTIWQQFRVTISRYLRTDVLVHFPPQTKRSDEE